MIDWLTVVGAAAEEEEQRGRGRRGGQKLRLSVLLVDVFFVFLFCTKDFKEGAWMRGKEVKKRERAAGVLVTDGREDGTGGERQ